MVTSNLSRESTNLAELQSTPFRTSRKADKRNTDLMNKLGVRHRYVPARLAIARSLAISSQPEPLTEEEEEEAGKTIRGENLFGTGGELAAWIALIVEHGALSNPSRKEIQEQVKRHWHRGIERLWQEWLECKDDMDELMFLIRLAERAGVREEGGISRDGDGSVSDTDQIGSVMPVRARLGEIGTIDSSQLPAEWTINKSGHTPHFGVFGKAGKGKTRTAKHILRQVARQRVPILYVDPKGDLRADRTFAAEINATPIVLGRDPVPLDALARTTAEDGELIRVADGFVAAMKGAISEMGPKQEHTLRDVTKLALREAGVNRAVSLEDIAQAVDARYRKNNQRDVDVLNASLHKIKDYQLFRPELSPAEFFSRSWIILLHDVSDEAVRFVMLFLLDTLLRYLRSCPPAELDTKLDVRQLRLLLTIDEARRVMNVAPQSLLDGLVLECRSQGLSCFFLSQSPDHLDIASDDIVSQFETAATFEADVSSKAARRVLGPRATPGMVQELEIGTCLARIPGHDGPVIVRAWKSS